MCGIVGKVIFDKDDCVDRSVIKSMSDSIRHRGPDDEGFYIHKNVGLGHRRLSIIDLNTGHQPIFNEDGSIVIVFNGEIYNFLEIRGELIKKGHHFKTETDTEVIVHLYEEYQEKCLDRMNGMFSFALWDKREEKLFLARDRIGKKPLYYYFNHQKIVFASELKAILQDKTIPRNVSPSAVDLYLTYGYIPAPFSIFDDIHKLLPGHYAIVKKGQFEAKQYWDIRYNYDSPRTDLADLENISDILRSSVEMRLMSDVPIGAFLSGGVDSSAIVGLMSKFLDQPVKTFSIGFKEDAYNELADARFISKTFKTDHYEEIVDPDSINLLPKLIEIYDEPYADSSAIPTFYVSKLAREHVKVVLSGDGGDELFAGYLRYLSSNRDDFFFKLPDFIRVSLVGSLGRVLPRGFIGKNYFNYISLENEDRYMTKVGCFSGHMKKELYSKNFTDQIEKIDLNYFSANSDKDFITQYLYCDSKLYLPDDILVKVDRASMANSLEVRVPLLDYRLIEYAATIPPHKKIQGKNQKVIFKEALQHLLPEEVFYKKKQGFGVPLAVWFRGELKDFTYDTLLAKPASERGYFNKNQVKCLLDEHQVGRRDNSFYIWTLLVLELWQERFSRD